MDHYDNTYFNWQKHLGAFGGKAELFKFKDMVNSGDRVIDFGCGGGFLLANILCKEKIGIEINPAARNEAEMHGIKTIEKADSIADNWADVIISNHALEHVENPVQELKQLFTKLKPGGKIIFVVPYEKKNPYRPKDVNYHLFTWSEMNLGNLFSHVGFKVLEVKEIKHRWPPKYVQLRSILGQNGFDIACRIYGTLNNRISQLRIIAEKHVHGPSAEKEIPIV